MIKIISHARNFCLSLKIECISENSKVGANTLNIVYKIINYA